MSEPFAQEAGRHVTRISAGGLRHWKRGQKEEEPRMEDGPFSATDTKEMQVAKLNAVVRDLYQYLGTQGEATSDLARLWAGINSDDLTINLDPGSKRSFWQVNPSFLQQAVTAALNVRGTPGLFKGIFLRAYNNSDGSLVAADVAYSEATMTLAPTWDYPRAHS